MSQLTHYTHMTARQTSPPSTLRRWEASYSSGFSNQIELHPPTLPVHEPPRKSNRMVNPRKKKLVIEDETETEIPIGSPRRTTTKVSPLKKLKAQVSERKKKSDEHQVEKSVSRQLKRSNLSEKNLSAKPSGLKRLKGEMKMTEGIQEQITEVIQPETRELIRPDQPQVEIENEESSEIKKEREAREKLFGEITEE